MLCDKFTDFSDLSAASQPTLAFLLTPSFYPIMTSPTPQALVTGMVKIDVETRTGFRAITGQQSTSPCRCDRRT